jgi:hypothetical protein
MTRLVSFELGHLDFFRPNFIAEDIWRDLSDAFHNPKIEMASILGDTEVIAIVGVNRLRKGVGEVWALPCVGIERYSKAFVRNIKKVLDVCFNDLDMFRLEMAILHNWDTGKRWAKYLGFKEEGYAIKWDGVNDHHIYAKLRS